MKEATLFRRWLLLVTSIILISASKARTLLVEPFATSATIRTPLLSPSLSRELGICYSKRDGTVYAITGTCDSYIFCLRENAIVLPCPVNTGFSQAARGCIPEASIQCEQLATTILPATASTQGTCVGNEESAANQQACAGQPFGQLVSYPGNCSLFLVCNCEYPTVKSCPGGLWFNPASQVCDWPQNVDCQNNSGTTASSNPPATDSSSSGTDSSSLETDTPSTSTDVSSTHPTTDPITTSTSSVTDSSPTQTVPVDTSTATTSIQSSTDSPSTSTDVSSTHPTTDPITIETPSTSPGTDSSSTQTVPVDTSTATTSIQSSTDLPSSTNVPCTIPVGVSESSCQDEEDGTLMRYPYNCNAYINCTFGCPVLNYCPPDKVFNALLLICDTPDVAQCEEEPLPTTTTDLIPTTTVTQETPSSCTPPGVDINFCQNEKNGSLHSYPLNCTAYITCNMDCAELTYCPPGKVFNALLDICDTPDVADCPDIDETTTTTEATTVTYPPIDNSTCLNVPNGTLLPYPDDCAAYIKCWDGTPEIGFCPNDWLFNAVLSICDEPSDVDCEQNISTGTNTPTVSTTTTTTTTTISYNPCLNEAKDVTFPYSENCQSYYWCQGNGSFLLLSCPWNNWYDPLSGTCGPEVSPTACQDYTTTTIVITTTSSPTTSTPENRCQNEPSLTTFPIPNNCAQYEICTGNGDSIILDCPKNNYFNPVTGSCGPDVSETACQETAQSTTDTSSTTDVITESPITPPTGVCGNYQNGEMVPYPDNCQKYIVCIEPIPIAFTCESNLYFNEAEQKCDLQENTNCTVTGGPTTSPSTNNPTVVPSTICVGAANGTTFPYPENCRFYILCTGNDLYMLEMCNDNEYYDLQTSMCDANAPSDACLTDVSTSSTTRITTEVTTEIPEVTGICAGVPDGQMIAYPGNCSKYIVCDTPIPVGYDCSEGLEFNSALQKCTNPDEADCGILTTTTTISLTPTESTPTSKPPGIATCVGKPENTSIPYPYNCTKYIVCKQPIPVGYDCPEGLEFSAELETCVSPDEANCIYSNTTNTTMTPIITTTSQSTQNPNQQNVCCGKTLGTYVQYPNDCTKYIVCEYPIPIVAFCPENEIYDPFINECVSSNEGECSFTTTDLLSSSTAFIRRTTAAFSIDPTINSSTDYIDESTTTFDSTEMSQSSSTITTSENELGSSTITENPSTRITATNNDSNEFTTTTPDVSFTTITSTTDGYLSESTFETSTTSPWDDKSTWYSESTITTSTEMHTTEENTSTFVTDTTEDTTSKLSTLDSTTTNDDFSKLPATTTPNVSSTTIISTTDDHISQSTTTEKPSTYETSTTSHVSDKSTETSTSTPFETTTEVPITEEHSSSSSTERHTSEENTSTYVTDATEDTTSKLSTLDSTTTNDDSSKLPATTTPNVSSTTIISTTDDHISQSTTTEKPSTYETSTTSHVSDKSTEMSESTSFATTTEVPITEEHSSSSSTERHTSEENTSTYVTNTTEDTTSELSTLDSSTTTDDSSKLPATTTPNVSSTTIISTTDDHISQSTTTEKSSTYETSTTSHLSDKSTEMSESTPFETTPGFSTTEKNTLIPVTSTTETITSTSHSSNPTSDNNNESTVKSSSSTFISSTTINIPTTTSSTIKSTSSTSTTTRPTTSSSTSTTNKYAEDNANACENQKSGAQVVYYGNCSKYNFCFGGESVVLDCSSNWSFNPQKNQCVPSSTYKCPW